MAESRAAKIRRIKHDIRTDPNTACHVLREIWSRQTAFERFTGEHDSFHDGRGFQEKETRDMNDLYDALERTGFRWQALRADTLMKIQLRTAKYAGQYLDHLDELTERKARR